MEPVARLPAYDEPLAPRLFSAATLKRYLEGRLSSLETTIRHLGPGCRDGEAAKDLAGRLWAEFQVAPAMMHVAQLAIVGIHETLAVRWRGGGFIAWHRQWEEAMTIEVAIPFSGNRDLFQLRPNRARFCFDPPRGRVGESEITIQCTTPRVRIAELARESIEGEVSQIAKFLAWAVSQVDAFNHSLRELITAQLERRLEHLDSDYRLVEALGLPLRFDRREVISDATQSANRNWGRNLRATRGTED